MTCVTSRPEEQKLKPVDNLQIQEAIRGRWAAGQSGNPRGKKSGTRNKVTILAEKLIQSDLEDILAKLVSMAKGGDIEAIKLIITRLVPPARERTVKFEAPKITSAADLTQTINNIVEALAKGQITPTEASNITSVIERLKNLRENEEFRERLDEVEGYVKEKFAK